jgi:uncharacterized protein (DUF58 family)
MTAPPAPAPRKIPWTRRLLSAQGRSLEITRAGWLFLLLTLAVGFAAVNSGSNLLHVVFGCQIGMIIASGILSETMVRRPVVRRSLAAPAHARTAAALRVDVRNPAERGELLAISVEDDDRRLGAGQAGGVFVLSLPAGRSTELTTQVVLARRGRHSLPPAVVATRFPFGLFVKRRELPIGPPVIVYPHVREIEPGGAAARDAGEGDGARPVAARSGEVYGLRDYRDGDDAKHVNWVATARLDRPIMTEFEAPGRVERWVELGAGTADTPAFETMVEDAASLAVALLRGGEIAVGLRHAGAVVVPPGQGPDQESRILEFLALVGAEAS